MKTLIYKNKKWHSLKVLWNRKKGEKPKITLTEEKPIKAIRLKKDTKSAVVVTDDDGKVLKKRERPESRTRNLKVKK